MPSSNFLRTRVIDWSLRNVSYPQPTAVYVALFVTDPTAMGTGTEVSGDWYARQPITLAAQVTAGVTQNSNTISYANVSASSAPVMVKFFAIYDSATLGNLLYYGPLNVDKTLNAGDVATFVPGQIVVTAV